MAERLITYGIENNADVYAKDIRLGTRGSRFRFCFPDRREIDDAVSCRESMYTTPLQRPLSRTSAVSLEDIKTGLESFGGVPMRLEIKEFVGALVISDVYNANPASMEEALKELVRLKRKGRSLCLAICWNSAAMSKRPTGNCQAAVGRIDILVAVGREMVKASREFKGTVTGRKIRTAQGRSFQAYAVREIRFLLKGSRGMRMEKVLPKDDRQERGRMLYRIFIQSACTFSSPMNVFRYITFRAALAVISAMLLSLFIGPRIINWLKKISITQQIRDDGPQTHLKKTGTPTMGGIIVIACILLSMLMWGDLENIYVWIMILSLVGYGGIGLLDDYLKVIQEKSERASRLVQIRRTDTAGPCHRRCTLFKPQ